MKFGIKTSVPTFKSVAGVNRKLIGVFIFCNCNIFFRYFLINFIVFFVSVYNSYV